MLKYIKNIITSVENDNYELELCAATAIFFLFLATAAESIYQCRRCQRIFGNPPPILSRRTPLPWTPTHVRVRTIIFWNTFLTRIDQPHNCGINWDGTIRKMLKRLLLYCFKRFNVCAHWCSLPCGCGLAQSQDRAWSDVTNRIKCNLTHWCSLIRCCLTACGQMHLIKSDRVRRCEWIGNCLRSYNTHRHWADALEMMERKRRPSSSQIFGRGEYNNIRFILLVRTFCSKIPQRMVASRFSRPHHPLDPNSDPLGQRVFPTNYKRWPSSSFVSIYSVK